MRFTSAEAEFAVDQDHRDVELRVRPAFGLQVVLREGDTELPWDPAWHLDLRTSSGKRAWSAWFSVGDIDAMEPGNYLLLVEDVRGFEPIAPLPVSVRAGPRQKVVISVRQVR